MRGTSRSGSDDKRKLIYFFSRRDLSRLQKCFDEFAFATNGHAVEILKSTIEPPDFATLIPGIAIAF